MSHILKYCFPFFYLTHFMLCFCTSSLSKFPLSRFLFRPLIIHSFHLRVLLNFIIIFSLFMNFIYIYMCEICYISPGHAFPQLSWTSCKQRRKLKKAAGRQGKFIGTFFHIIISFFLYLLLLQQCRLFRAAQVKGKFSSFLLSVFFVFF